jgi:hypothetical protein
MEAMNAGGRLFSLPHLLSHSSGLEHGAFAEVALRSMAFIGRRPIMRTGGPEGRYGKGS